MGVMPPASSPSNKGERTPQINGGPMRGIATTFFAVLALLGTPSQKAEGQYQQSMFTSKSACNAAVLSGQYSSYEPKNFGLKGKNPRPGTVVDSVRLEQPGCFHLLTFKGWAWIAEGTGQWMITCNGVICGLLSCWNPADDFFYPSPSAPTIAALRGPQGLPGIKGDKGEKGDQGNPGPVLLVAKDNHCGTKCGAAIVAGGVILGSTIAIIASRHHDNVPPPLPVCEDPKATNYKGALPCTFPPGGATGPAFIRGWTVGIGFRFR